MARRPPIALTRTSAKANDLKTPWGFDSHCHHRTRCGRRSQSAHGRRGAELVFDPVGGPQFATLAKATANGGLLILYGALDTQPTLIPPFDIFARDLTVRGLALSALTRDDEMLTALTQFVTEGLEAGALRPTIARLFPFEQIVEAHRFMEEGTQVGKIVVTL